MLFFISTIEKFVVQTSCESQEIKNKNDISVKHWAHFILVSQRASRRHTLCGAETHLKT